MANDPRILSVDASSLNKIAEVLEGMPNEVEEVIRRVLYRVKDNARAEIVRQVPKVYAISKDMIRTALNKRTIRVSHQDEEQVAIVVLGRPINLIRFPHSPGVPVYGKKRYTVIPQVMIKREKGMNSIEGVRRARFWLDASQPARKRKPGTQKKTAFLMPTTKSNDGTKTPFFFAMRTGKPSSRNPKREGVEGVASLSIPQMVLNPAVAEPLQKYIETQMAKRVDVELTNMVVKMQGQVKK